MTKRAMTKRQCFRKLILAIRAERIRCLLIEIDAARDNGDGDLAVDLETELDEAPRWTARRARTCR
jgi:hypothetical protein